MLRREESTHCDRHPATVGRKPEILFGAVQEISSAPMPEGLLHFGAGERAHGRSVWFGVHGGDLRQRHRH